MEEPREKRKELYLIPYSHLDTQWRWEYPTTINLYIKNTLDENLHLFEHYPEYRFNFTGSLRYAMMKEYYPEKFEKAKKYIKSGKWALCGTCLDETDALIPSVESLLRNILYGDRWAKNEFGISSRDYMIPDCFGFPANMPTVLAHAGIKGFSSQKLTWNSAIGIPFEMGVWKGPDGSGITSVFNPGSYNTRLRHSIYKDAAKLKKIETLGQKNNIWKSFQYYGVGDIGGAPTENSVKNAISDIKIASDGVDLPVIRQGSPDQFFNELADEEIARMDSYSGDLLLINHSTGMLTSAAIMKRWNRKNEQMAFAAEVAATSAMLLTGAQYPSEKIKSAWFRVIGNQMHDILPGTCTPTAYEYSQNDEVVALNTWNSIILDSAHALAPFIPGNGTLLLFNPLGERRRDVVEIQLDEKGEIHERLIKIVDSTGKEIPAQIQKNQQGLYTALMIAETPPFGWERFTVLPSEIYPESSISNPVTLFENETGYMLENSFYLVKISKNGQIFSIFHKELKKELLKKPLAYEFQHERPILFPSWNMYWYDRKNPPIARLESGDEVSVIESGPLRCSLQIVTKYKSSILRKSISLSHNSEIVEFAEHIDWKESGCSLKFAMNTNMVKPEVTYNWETAHINRGINSPALFEMPSRLWVDMHETDWGVSIIEDSKYGYDHPQDDTLRMTLLYTPGIWYVTGYWDQKSQDWGEHHIRYGIYAHKGDFKGTDQIARRFNQKIRSFKINNESAFESKIIPALFELSSNQVGILAVKKAEESDGVLIRLYERYGSEINTEIIFKHPILGVKEVNGLEEQLSSIPMEQNKFSVKMGANQIRSFIVKLKNNLTEHKISQEPLSIPYNCNKMGQPGDSTAIYPIELIPKTIQAGNITYHLQVDIKPNTLQCQGQKIPLPERYNTLSLLIAGEEKAEVSFQWLNQQAKVIKAEKCSISPATGYIGQWDTRIWWRKPTHHLKNQRDYAWINKCIGVEPGFINRSRLEYYTTHTIKDGKVQPYHYGYLYTLQLDIPKGAISLLLPEDSKVFIIAMTASQQAIELKAVNILHDKFDF
jgi:alpha-mannosidase